MKETRTPGKRSAEDAEVTREAILNAALKAFSVDGFKGAGVRDIAASAGVSHGVVRHHFGSKMDLWKQAIDQVFDYFGSRMIPVIEGVESSSKEGRGTALSSFRTVVAEFIDISLANPGFARLFVLSMRDEGERADYCGERFGQLHGAIGQLFYRAQKESPALAAHSNDSFFYCLMSLTYFRLLFPSLGAAVEYPVSKDITDQKSLILSVLIPEKS